MELDSEIQSKETLYSTKKRRIAEFIVDDEMLIKVGFSELIWLCWISVDIKSKEKIL
jgi:hypothetical protein